MQTMIIEAVKNGVLDERLNGFNEFSDADAIILLLDQYCSSNLER